MKPKNFSERKKWRRVRAKARAAGQPMPTTPPHVDDMCFRVGREARESALAYEDAREAVLLGNAARLGAMPGTN